VGNAKDWDWESKPSDSVGFRDSKSLESLAWEIAEPTVPVGVNVIRRIPPAISLAVTLEKEIPIPAHRDSQHGWLGFLSLESYGLGKISGNSYSLKG